MTAQCRAVDLFLQRRGGQAAPPALARDASGRVVAALIASGGGAFMEPRGRNQWQTAANAPTLETAKISENRRGGLPPVACEFDCNVLAEGLRSRGVSPVVLEGGLGKRARTTLLDTIARTSPTEPLVVVATGQYLGEGFDCPQLDTLFLAFPVSFKGRLVQYTGRLLRAHDGKTSVRVYDYADVRVPVLRAMHTRRLATYKRLGFSENELAATSTQLAVPILVT